MSETDNFSHRAGYADDPLAVAIRYARKGGTLAAGEGALLVKEIERLEARVGELLDGWMNDKQTRRSREEELSAALVRAERAEAVLAKLREPSDAVCDTGDRHWSWYNWPDLIPIIVAAAEAEVGP
jgi:hypothetical protein